MGTLTYGTDPRHVDIDDVVLEHIKAIVMAQLLLDDSIVLSVHPDRLDGPDRIVLHPRMPIRFDFEGPIPPPLVPEVIAELSATIDEPGGVVVPEARTPG